MLIISFLRICLDLVNSLTPHAFDKLTGAIWINNVGSTDFTCKDTIKRKALINLVTHTTNIELGISGHRLAECAFITVYCPKL